MPTQTALSVVDLLEIHVHLILVSASSVRAMVYTILHQIEWSGATVVMCKPVLVSKPIILEITDLWIGTLWASKNWLVID